jgi:hypothetical protein
MPFGKALGAQFEILIDGKPLVSRPQGCRHRGRQVSQAQAPPQRGGGEGPGEREGDGGGLQGGRGAAATRADELTAQISDVRDRLNGRVWRQGDDPAELRIEFDRLLAEQKALQARRPIDMGIIESCKAWLAALPTATLLEQVNPGVEDGLSLSAVRARIKKLKNQVEVLKGVPIPPSNVREEVQTYVQRLTRRPTLRSKLCANEPGFFSNLRWLPAPGCHSRSCNASCGIRSRHRQLTNSWRLWPAG